MHYTGREVALRVNKHCFNMQDELQHTSREVLTSAMYCYAADVLVAALRPCVELLLVELLPMKGGTIVNFKESFLKKGKQNDAENGGNYVRMKTCSFVLCQP